MTLERCPTAGVAAFDLIRLGVVLLRNSSEIGLIVILGGMTPGVTAALVFTTMDGILKAALYVYAVDGKIPNRFDNELVTNAFSNEK